MKKVVFKTYQFPSKSQTFVTNQIVAAIEMGYDVSVLTTMKLDFDSSSQTEIFKKYDLLQKTTEIKDSKPRNWFLVYIKALHLILNGYSPSYLKTFNFFRYKRLGFSGRLFYDMVNLNPFKETDLFHVQFAQNSKSLIRLKKHNFLHSEIIITTHGYDVHYTNKTFKKRQLDYDDIFNFASKITCNTKYLADKLLALGCPKSKLEIIPMGIDTDYFVPIKKEFVNKKTYSLLSVGRLIKLKSFDLGIRAVFELIKKGHPISYEIIGEGDEQENLNQLIKKLDLEEFVHLVGAKNQQYIRDTMQQSDIFLMTSTHDKEGRRETQGVVTGEAQACGIPVCAFDSGGVPYTLIDGETGFLSEENDHHDLANNIERLIIENGLREKMSLSAREFVLDNYSLEISAAKMQAVYEKTINKLLA